jgi:hypothetical protein
VDVRDMAMEELRRNVGVVDDIDHLGNRRVRAVGELLENQHKALVFSQFVDHHEWQGTRDLAAFLSVPAAIQFQKENGWDSVRGVCHSLAVDAEMRIRELIGLPSLYSNDAWFAQMVAVPLPVEPISLRSNRVCMRNFESKCL